MRRCIEGDNRFDKFIIYQNCFNSIHIPLCPLNYKYLELITLIIDSDTTIFSEPGWHLVCKWRGWNKSAIL